MQNTNSTNSNAAAANSNAAAANSAANSAANKAAAKKAAATAKQTAALLIAYKAAQTKQRKTSNVQIACNLLASNATATQIVNTFAALYAHKKVSLNFVAKRAAIYMQIAQRKAAAKSSK